ncbi:MAG: sigma-70 family RNA polymerase sigma factor [Bacillota bacterium]|nr:sigma-70 family RNA polymerase sigma factor [Bacillota bacterium]
MNFIQRHFYQTLPEELPADENNKLAVKAKTDNKCRDKLIIHNTRLVKWVADKYSFQTFLTEGDLFQEGILGLIKAVDKYDPNKGAKFSTYAVWHIKQYITRAIGNTERTVRVPIGMLQLISDLEKIKKQILKDENKRPTVIELSKRMELPVSKIKAIIKASEEVDSLDRPIAGEGEEISLLDAIADDGPTPEDIAESKVFIEQFIDEFKYKLEPIELDSIIMYYGLNEEGKCYTFKQIAEIHKVSTGRIGQVRDKALKKVRESLFIKELMEEVDYETSFIKTMDFTQPFVKGGGHSSPVEALALKREELLERKLKYYNKDDVNET